MSDNYDDPDSSVHDCLTDQMSDNTVSVSFGDYNVISPGVHIILDGRPVSNSGR